MDSNEIDSRLQQLTRIDHILEEISDVDGKGEADLRPYSNAIEDAFIAVHGAQSALEELQRVALKSGTFPAAKGGANRKGA